MVAGWRASATTMKAPDSEPLRQEVPRAASFIPLTTVSACCPERGNGRAKLQTAIFLIASPVIFGRYRLTLGRGGLVVVPLGLGLRQSLAATLNIIGVIFDHTTSANVLEDFPEIRTPNGRPLPTAGFEV